MLSAKAKDMASSATPGTGLKLMIFLAALAFFSVVRRNTQPFVSLSPGSVATHLRLLESIPAPIGEAPGQSPTKAVGKAVGFVRESLKAIVDPQPAAEAEDVAGKRLSPTFSVLALTDDGEASLIQHREVLWSQQGEPHSSLYLDDEGELRLGKSKVVVGSELSSSWPFDAGKTTRHGNAILRRVKGIAVTGLGLVALRFVPAAAWGAAARVFGKRGAKEVVKGAAKAKAGKNAVKAGGKLARRAAGK